MAFASSRWHEVPAKGDCAKRSARGNRYDANPQYWDDLATSDIWRLGLDVGDGQDNHALAIWRGPVLYDVQIHPTVGDRAQRSAIMRSHRYCQSC